MLFTNIVQLETLDLQKAGFNANEWWRQNQLLLVPSRQQPLKYTSKIQSQTKPSIPTPCQQVIQSNNAPIHLHVTSPVPGHVIKPPNPHRSSPLYPVKTSNLLPLNLFSCALSPPISTPVSIIHDNSPYNAYAYDDKDCGVDERVHSFLIMIVVRESWFGLLSRLGLRLKAGKAIEKEELE